MASTESRAKRIIRAALRASLLLGVTGCGADFDSPDIVKTLRVLAVQKDHPYAAPSTDPANLNRVHLSMLSYDGAQKSPGEPRKIQRLWFSGCDDLPGDQYFTCLVRMYFLWQAYYDPAVPVARLPWQDGMSWSPIDDIPADIPAEQRAQLVQAIVAQVDPTMPAELAESYLSTFRIGAGSTFEYPIPPRIIENHQPSSDPTLPPYGLSFIFFTACAGQLELAPEWKNIDFKTQLRNATLGFPFICVDDSGAALGPDDFVAGYSQQFVYAGREYNNPVIDGANFNGTETSSAARCLEDGCIEPTMPSCVDDTSKQLPHVPACTGKCPTYEFSPVMNPDADGNKVDAFASQTGSVDKQMWINYYTDKGSLKHSVRRLRDVDPSVGWNTDNYATTWTPPASPGPVNLWAAVHDTRGGVAWTRLLVCVD